jgi:hypothetical protein
MSSCDTNPGPPAAVPARYMLIVSVASGTVPRFPSLGTAIWGAFWMAVAVLEDVDGARGRRPPPRGSSAAAPVCLVEYKSRLKM